MNVDYVLLGGDITMMGGTLVTYILAYLQQSSIDQTDMILTQNWAKFSKVFRSAIVLLGLASIAIEIQFLYLRLNLRIAENIGANVRMVNHVVMKGLAIVYFISCSYLLQRALNPSLKVSSDAKVRSSMIRIKLLFLSAFSMMIWIIAASVQMSEWYIKSTSFTDYTNTVITFVILNISDCITHTFQQIYIAPGKDLIWIADNLCSCFKLQGRNQDPDSRETSKADHLLMTFSNATLEAELIQH
jgi:hypothetical protein